MRGRRRLDLVPGVERLEGKRLLSLGRLRAPRVAATIATAEQARHPLPPLSRRFTLYRITNPTPFNARLTPPFEQVLVQNTAPVPGQVYNICFVSVRNGTRQTFDAKSGLQVRFSGQKDAFPILKGDQTWRPGERFVFYVLTKKYYPPNPVVSGGFQFNLAGSPGTAIPGPSGIFLRVKYDPARFARTLDAIVAFGPGARGSHLGLPNTSIWEFIPATQYIVPL